MGIGITIVAIAAAVGAWMLIQSTSRAASVPAKPVSPFDEAERILSTRYARGLITPEEYERMLSVLRR